MEFKMSNSTAEKDITSFKSHLLKRVLLYTVILPASGVLVLGGFELITAYFSNLHDFAPGIVIAQILSIIGDVLTFCCLFLGYCSLGAFQMSFGSSSSKKAFGLVLVSPVVSTLMSLAVFYVLVAIGWHDYSLRMFFDYIPVFLANAGLSAIINTLVSVIVFVAFYLSGPVRSDFHTDKRYRFTVKLVMGMLILIKAASLGMDIVLYDGGYSSINNIIGGIVFPILYEVLEVGAALFFTKKFIESLVERTNRYGISF